MATKLNTINLVGRAGRDPEIVYFESGTCKAKFSIAVNRTQKDAPPDWFDIEFWGKTAEVAGNYVKKGSLVGIQGQIIIERWQDKTTGQDRAKLVVRGDKLHLLGSKGDSTSQQSSYNDAVVTDTWGNNEVPF